MTTSLKNKSSGLFKGVLAAMTLLWMTALPFSAQAVLQGSAGNTIVRNTITVNYSDAKGNAQTAVTSTVDITINTVAATPTILSVAPSPGSTDGTGTTQAYTFRIRTNSNGPGAVTFATADGTFTNIAAGAAPTLPASIYLGSTVIDPSEAKIGSAQTVANLASITFAVPNDNHAVNNTGAAGVVGDLIINGLIIGDLVYIYSGAAYYGPFTVGTVTDPAAGAGATAAPGSIQLINNTGASIGPFTPAYGWQIVEARDVTVTATQGIVTDPTLDASWITTLTATMAGAAAANTPTVTTNAHMGRIAITKYVRNVTTPVVGGGLTSTSPLTGANIFYTTGVNGKPGEYLEYLAVLTDTGKGSATAVYATDVMPTYSTLVTFPATYGTTPGSAIPGIFALSSFNATTAILRTDNTGGTANVAYGRSTGIAAGSTMTFNLGTGCTNVYPTGGGTIATTQAVYVIYQVKID